MAASPSREAIGCRTWTSDATLLLTLTAIFLLAFLSGSNGQNAPVFVIDPQSTTARLGENVSLKCKTVPPTEVLWMYDNLPIVSNTSYEIRSDEVSGEHEIIIKSISMRRDGPYRCRTQDTTSKPVNSQSAQVTVIVAPSDIKLLPFNPSTVVQENMETSLTCRVSGGKPAPTIQWFKDQDRMETGVETQVQPSDETRIENVTSTLKWTPTRGDHEKHVYCTATHQALLDGPLRVETLLNVEFAPSVKIVSVPEIVKEGDAVTLQCLADANPYIDLKFRWTKNGLPMTDVSSGSLHIDAAQRSERPTVYSCEATNKVGTGMASFSLDVCYPASFFSMQEVVGADLHQETFLNCNVDSNPKADITWEKAGQVVGKEATLQLRTQSDRDFGVYQCVASTSLGQVRKEVRLLQKGPPFISAEASVYAEQKQSSVQIKCVSNGIPLVHSVRWTTPQGRLVNPYIDPRMEVSQEALPDRVISKLTIKDVRKEDFGLYNCSANNAYGLNERLIPLKETDWLMPIIIGCACGGVLLLTIVVVSAVCCYTKCRSHNRLKQASDTSGSTTASDDLDHKSTNGPHGVLHGMYNTSNDSLADGKSNGWNSGTTGRTTNGLLNGVHPYTIQEGYGRKDPQNYYTRYADYEQEYNPNSFLGLPVMYTPTMSMEGMQAEQEGSRDPSPYHATSGLPKVEPLYVRYPAVNGAALMLDSALNSRLATNV